MRGTFAHAMVEAGGTMQTCLVAELLVLSCSCSPACGSAVLAAAFPEPGTGFVGVAFAFGLTGLTMAYAGGVGLRPLGCAVA
jgi:aquaporin Z